MNIEHNKIPFLLEEFLILVGLERGLNNKLSKSHKFYKVLDYYLKHKNESWENIDRPEFFYKNLDDIINIVILKPILDKQRKKKPLNVFLRVGMMDSFCVEAMLAVQYMKNGYMVRWLSALQMDPPDLRVYDPTTKTTIDIEVKTVAGVQSVKSMFRSFAKGYQSLRNRKDGLRNPGVVVVHAKDNLGWVKWLKDEEINNRLRSHFQRDEYKIISGVIFSGGMNKTKDAQQYGIPHVGFRSNVATFPLPTGFKL